MTDFDNWPAWVTPMMWTVATLVGSWAVGHALRIVLMSRVSRWAGASQPGLDAIAREIGARVPWWCLLVGIWLAAGYWPLTSEIHLLVERAVFVVGGLSATLAIAAISGRLVDRYGDVIAPGLQVTSLTRNVVWALMATLGALIILNGLGLSITPMLTALGVGGLAVALALQEPPGADGLAIEVREDAAALGQPRRHILDGLVEGA